MNRASPADLRKSLLMADAFAKIGVDFVPIPVADEADKARLLNEMDAQLERIAILSEKGVDKHEHEQSIQ